MDKRTEFELQLEQFITENLGNKVTNTLATGLYGSIFNAHNNSLNALKKDQAAKEQADK